MIRDAVTGARDLRSGRPPGGPARYDAQRRRPRRRALHATPHRSQGHPTPFFRNLLEGTDAGFRRSLTWREAPKASLFFVAARPARRRSPRNRIGLVRLRSLAVAAVAVAMGGSPLLADATADALRAGLAVERRRLADDQQDLRQLSVRIQAALDGVATALKAASPAEDGERSDEEIDQAEAALERQRQELAGLLAKRRLVAARMLDRRRTIDAIQQELASHSHGRADRLSGRWRVVISPGAQEGVFRMSLDGALVSGDFELEGGYAGSLRGTLVEDRLRVERVDSKLGAIAVYYGRLSQDGTTISGTWELSNLSAGTPTSGRWSATRIRETP
jgi:hypothetical protein